MLLDLNGRPIAQQDGWYGARIIDAGEAYRHKGLQEQAALVKAGGLHPRTPLFVVWKRLDAPYPDACVAVPTDEATARAVLAGDPSSLADLLEDAEDTLARFLERVKANAVE